MPERVSISVVIPTFQRRDTVGTAVSSVLDQVDPADEVIVVDDGSTDGTVEALRDRFGDRIVVIPRDNGGPAAARNSAIAAATSEVISFLDSDNRWLPEHLAVTRALFAAHPESVLVATQRNYRFGKERLAGAHSADIAYDLITLRTSVGLLSSASVRRRSLVEVGGFDESIWYGEDVDLFLRLSLLGPFTMLRARTVVHGTDGTESLHARGLASGGYTQFVTASGKRLAAVLADSTRPDAEALRRAAEGRVVIGELFELLVADGPSAEGRARCAEIRRLVPEHARNPSGIVFALPSLVSGWESRRVRAAVLRKLFASWGAVPVAGAARLWAASAMVAVTT
jgi:hypothetical protein